MIKDKTFKRLPHKYKDFSIFSKGETVELGYRPDYVLNKNNHYIIFESENASSRKTFIGGMIKAAHFLTNKKSGYLVYVMTPKKNTTLKSIAEQLSTYFQWVKGITNLEKIYVIEANQYYISLNKVLEIESKEFNDIALSILPKEKNNY